MDVPHLCRALVCDRGGVKGLYSDGSVIALSADCRRYVYADKEGRTFSHLTECARRKHGQQLRRLLRFRNLHCANSFYASWVMEDDVREREVDNFSPSSAIEWTLTLEEARQNGLVTRTGNCVSVRREGGKECLVYDPVGERIVIREVISIRTIEDDERTIVEDKVYPIDRYPVRWRAPLRLAIAYVSDQATIEDGDASDRTMIQDGDASFTEGWLNATNSPMVGLSDFLSNSWWVKHTTVLPNSISIVLDWTPDVYYIFRRSSGEVRAWISKDGTFLATSQEGRFLRHREGWPVRERIYAAQSLARDVVADQGETLHSLASIAAHALLLRKAGLKSGKHCSSVDDDSVASSDVHEELQSPAGKFTAYRDGRVKAKFINRTIVKIDSDGTECVAILPNGKRLVVSCDVPIGIEREVAKAMDFRRWAFSPPEVRRSVADEYERASRQALECRLNAAVCRWTARKRSIDR